MKSEKSQPEGKRIMPETRFTEFPALSFDPRVGISRSASETDVWLAFLPMTLKIYYSSFVIFFHFFDILRRITTFSERHSFFFSWWRKSDVTSEIKSSDVIFNVTCELSKPMDKIEFSRTAKKWTNCLKGKGKKNESYTSEVALKKSGRNNIISPIHLAVIWDIVWLVGWLVGCFGLNALLRQYFSLYRAVSQRDGERKEKW